MAETRPAAILWLPQDMQEGTDCHCNVVANLSRPRSMISWSERVNLKSPSFDGRESQGFSWRVNESKICVALTFLPPLLPPPHHRRVSLWVRVATPLSTARSAWRIRWAFHSHLHCRQGSHSGTLTGRYTIAPRSRKSRLNHGRRDSIYGARPMLDSRSSVPFFLYAHHKYF